MSFNPGGGIISTVDSGTQPANAIPAGWYADPTQPGAQRWWSGIGWTEHIHVPAPVLVAPPIAPAPTTPQNAIPQNHTPFQSTVVQQAAMPIAQVAPAGPISNKSAWLSLGLGAFAVVFVGFYLETHPNGIVVSSAAATSIFWGVRAIIHRRQGRATVLWAPIVGITLGVISVVLIVAALFGSFVTALGAGAGIDPVPQTQQPFQESAPPRPDLSNNPELNSLLNVTFVVQASLEFQHTRTNAYPASLTIGSGKVAWPDGSVLTTIDPGWQGQYKTTDGGASYTLEFIGTKGGNRAGYSSADKKTTYDCNYKDCNVDPDTQPAQTTPDTPNA